MSRWLSSVNNLLEHLDGKVETAVEDQIHRVEEENQHGVHSDVLEDILTKRGLTANDETESKYSEEAAPSDDRQAAQMEEPDGKREANVLVGEKDSSIKPPDTVEEPLQAGIDSSDKVSADDTHPEPMNQPGEDTAVPAEEVQGQSSNDNLDNVEITDESGVGTEPAGAAEGRETAADAEKTEASDALNLQKEPPPPEPTESKPMKTEPEQSPPTSAPVVVEPDPGLQKEYEKALSEAREAQKEARTLSRHVVSLNSQLEAAEAEIKAQRTELERAAERMERDRTRQKEEKERQVARHAEEIKALRTQHEGAIADNKTRSDEQLEDARKRLKELEERRMQEGGDWTKELEEAVKREQVAMQRMVMLEDEKSTLLSQVSTLQSQQTALESRMESITQTADTAMEREREAEDRLDSALSLHARQLTQRQAREAELERTVADLGAALVVARNREINRLKGNQQQGIVVDSESADLDKSLQAKLEASEDERETVHAQLELERQRCETLHQELRDMSQERTEEASAAHARQLQHDRQLADMSSTISRLQANLRDSKNESSRRNSGLGDEDSLTGDVEKIKTLSEQVVRKEEKIRNCNSEISALRSRLRSALSRAESAEQALTVSGNSTDAWDALERGAPIRGNSNGEWPKTMRRRGGHRKGSESYGGSIRSAIRLEPGQAEGKEKLGKAIDQLDQWSVETGKYLRYNPLARGAFLLYLIVLHLWTFVLLMFHAHNFETVHGDFGAGKQVPHGPHALMQNAHPSLRGP